MTLPSHDYLQEITSAARRSSSSAEVVRACVLIGKAIRGLESVPSAAEQRLALIGVRGDLLLTLKAPSRPQNLH